ncbi:MAG TPA: AgmX/PglI C-terminal domain-containing protein, partial [Gammaproteobacteria bacterium]|nr:AgmX/PglI C-terminal domain-containing protein [Gammaproteobacteria bacterium]
MQPQAKEKAAREVQKPKPAIAATPEAKPKVAASPRRSRSKPVLKAPKADEAERIRQAREQASTAGLLAFTDQLSSLRDNDTVAKLGAEAVADVHTSGAGNAAAPVAQRSIITSKIGRGSGGIVTAATSRNLGGGAVLAGRKTTRVANPFSGLTANGEGGTVGAAGGAPGGQGEPPARSREEIERVFDKNKGAIYALYNRALRRNPALQGKVVLRLTIEPGGRVRDCVVVSSELGDSELEEKLVQRIKLFVFEARDVAPTTITKPIDFFP